MRTMTEAMFEAKKHASQRHRSALTQKSPVCTRRRLHHDYLV
jgi:hypothetical protein